MASDPEAREWIIRRCTQRWIGTSLIYEDWPIESIVGHSHALTREEMIATLDACVERWPDEEFCGHNVENCKCHAKATFSC